MTDANKYLEKIAQICLGNIITGNMNAADKLRRLGKITAEGITGSRFKRAENTLRSQSLKKSIKDRVKGTDSTPTPYRHDKVTNAISSRNKLLKSVGVASVAGAGLVGGLSLTNSKNLPFEKEAAVLNYKSLKGVLSGNLGIGGKLDRAERLVEDSLNTTRNSRIDTYLKSKKEKVFSNLSKDRDVADAFRKVYNVNQRQALNNKSKDIVSANKIAVRTAKVAKTAWDVTSPIRKMVIGA